MNWKRRLVTGLVALAVLVVSGLVAAKIYLRSRAVADRVARRLEEKLGAPVRVGEADIGLFGSSTLRNVEVAEGDGNDAAWLTVEEISFDVSAFDLLLGKGSPDRVTLKGAKADLR